MRKRIIELGFDPSKPLHTWDVRARLEALGRVIDSNTLHEMRHLSRKLAQAADSLEQLKTGKTDNEEEAAS